MSDSTQPPASDTIAGLSQGLGEWFELQEPGVVWVRYRSDLSRDALLNDLGAKHSIAVLRFDPPSAAQACVWLESRLREYPLPGPDLPVVAVVFPLQLQGSREIFLAAFRSLNLRREDLLLLPLIQLWIISDAVSAMAELEAPDLVSWFKLRRWLNEIPAASGVGTSDADEQHPNMRLAPLASRKRALVEALLRIEAARRRFEQGKQNSVSDLAEELHRLSTTQDNLGMLDAALASTVEATDLSRTLSNEEAFLPDLAGSLNNLATMQSAVGRREEALGTAEEAVKIRRELARRNEEAFLPNLAASLNNLANRQSDVGRREEALGTAEEAVKHYRELARRNEEAFLPDLAMSLGAMSQIYAGKSDWSKAQLCLTEAVQLLLPIYEALPPAHAPLMRQLREAYIQACASANIPLNEDWLTRIEAKLAQIPQP